MPAQPCLRNAQTTLHATMSPTPSPAHEGSNEQGGEGGSGGNGEVSALICLRCAWTCSARSRCTKHLYKQIRTTRTTFRTTGSSFPTSSKITGRRNRCSNPSHRARELRNISSRDRHVRMLWAGTSGPWKSNLTMRMVPTTMLSYWIRR